MNDKYYRELIAVLLKIETTKQMRNFLQGILTPQELNEIPTRLQIVKMLKKKIPQQQITQKLKVGIATVTRGSKELAKGNFKYI